MPFEYVNVDEAIARRGLRMVVVGNVPSPWGEAAKGILHIKGIDWVAVRLAYDSEPLKAWAGGQRSGPVAIYDDERPRAGWAEILLLAERLAPTPALIHAGLQGAGGFAPRVATYLAKKYGYSPEAGAAAGARVAALLGMLTSRLKAQQAAGSRFYVGNALSAVDIYSATFMALLSPLPQGKCAMDAGSRAAMETLDAATAAALDPMLLEHRDMMYQERLELPLSL
jgi:hypothetical protein